MDLIADYALPLPITVIADMLGIPAGDRDNVFDWSQAIISPGRHHLTFRARRRKVRTFVEYLRQMFADRQQHPRDDLTTALVQAEQAGDKLTEMELSSMVALLFVTGHETTVNLIGNGVLALLQHPHQLAMFKENPGLMETAVEELLRFDGPVETSTTRWAREDVEMHGQHIKRGDIVRVVLASANRDPACCPHPNHLDVTRREQRHLAFGHGIHYCLGAPLARLEGHIALETLLRRMPNLRLAVPVDQLQWHSGVLFRGLESLPLTWD
jgi:cytochrome P450 PksS